MIFPNLVESPKLQAVQQAFQSAIQRIFNSDQGSHFTSKSYIDLLKQHDVRISMDGRGRALDNIFTERLWRTIKQEEVYSKEYDSPRTARHELIRYLRFYNEGCLTIALQRRSIGSADKEVFSLFKSTTSVAGTVRLCQGRFTF